MPLPEKDRNSFVPVSINPRLLVGVEVKNRKKNNTCIRVRSKACINWSDCVNCSTSSLHLLQLFSFVLSYFVVVSTIRTECSNKTEINDDAGLNLDSWRIESEKLASVERKFPAFSSLAANVAFLFILYRTLCF